MYICFMKKLITLIQANPSYSKWGNKKLAEKLGLKEVTIKRLKSQDSFKSLKSEYIKSLNGKTTI